MSDGNNDNSVVTKALFWEGLKGGSKGPEHRQFHLASLISRMLIESTVSNLVIKLWSMNRTDKQSDSGIEIDKTEAARMLISKFLVESSLRKMVTSTSL
ncbi:hypothetical protein Tco_0227922 [Tanacetum coccineum]